MAGWWWEKESRPEGRLLPRRQSTWIVSVREGISIYVTKYGTILQFTGQPDAILQDCRIIAHSHVLSKTVDWMMVDEVRTSAGKLCLRESIHQAAQRLTVSEVLFRSVVWSDYRACAGSLVRCHHNDLEMRNDTDQTVGEHQQYTRRRCSDLKSQAANLNWNVHVQL